MSIWGKDFDDDEIDDYESYLRDHEINSFLDLTRQPNSEDQNFFTEDDFIIDYQSFEQTSKNQQSQDCISDSTSKGPPPEEEEIPPLLPSPKKEPSIPFSMDRIPQKRIDMLLNIKQDQSLRNFCDPKLKIGLSEKQSSFKQQFYSIFLNDIKGKNIFPKEKVIVIHNSICVQAGVRRMKRDEYRAINNYFKHFAKYKNQILKSIIENKEELSSLIDLPSIIEKANANYPTKKK
ncbi:hypothetical protein M9Y10_025916 [Tritrichomonas musculus]|uniref:Uncharacterized protein n=1 Tax=Tritrichomonas musculus TaxID=1915356 RepID=A0ABR2H7X4_9EUKA